MGKVKFKPGYVDLGAYPLLLHIINEGGLEAEGGGGLNTTLTDPFTLTNVNGNILGIGNYENNYQNVFISLTEGNVSYSGIATFLEPNAVSGISTGINKISNDIRTSFETTSVYSGDVYYKAINQLVDGDTGENILEINCFKNDLANGAVIQFDDLSNDTFIGIATNNNTYDKDYLLKVSTIRGTTPFFALTVNGAIETILPTYASNAAADADTSLPVGGLYQLTGDRTVYRKP